MLKNLLKYDLKWTYKAVLVFYMLAFLFAVFSRIFMSFDNSLILSIVSKVCTGCSTGMMVSILINNIMRVWARFVRNMYGDEAYLTHTLPVPKKTIFLSKVLSACITTFTSVIVIFICLFICYYSKENMTILKNMLDLVATAYNSTVIKLIIVLALIFFLEIFFTILVGYTGIIFGHKSNNAKMPKSIIYGFILYMATQALTLITIYVSGLFNSNIMNLFTSSDVANIGVIKTILYIAIIIYIVYISIYYILDKYLLNKGVDID